MNIIIQKVSNQYQTKWEERVRYSLQDFDYKLPDELIARYPVSTRSHSRLLCLDGQTGMITHRQFSDLVSLLSKDDLLVCNNSRVIPARLWGKKETGGQVEVLIERILDEKKALAQIRASKSPKAGSSLIFAEGIRFAVLGREEDLFVLSSEESE